MSGPDNRVCIALKKPFCLSLFQEWWRSVRDYVSGTLAPFFIDVRAGTSRRYNERRDMMCSMTRAWSVLCAALVLGCSASSSSSSSPDANAPDATKDAMPSADAYIDAPGTASDAGATETATDAGLAPLGPPGAWTIAFDDEFEGTTLDKNKWGTLGWTVNGVTTDAANVSVSGGNLVLTLASSSSGAAVCSCTNGGAKNDFVVAVGEYAEARVSFPGSGATIYNWPAWWISGPNWPAAGENDIAEGLGTLTVNYHSPSGAHNQGTIPGTWSNAFHVYGALRKASSTDVYWDGVLVKSYPTDDNGQGEQLLVNVGDGNTHVYGTGSRVLVDYVRAFVPN